MHVRFKAVELVRNGRKTHTEVDQSQGVMTMSILIAGLLIFFAGHSLPMFPRYRDPLVNRFGEQKYKGIFALFAAVGFALILWGYSRAPQVELWQPPGWGYRAAMLMMPVAFVAMMSGQIANNFQRVIRHPLLLGVAIWAAAHLLANGDLASLLLFASFLVYSIIDMYSANRRGATVAKAKLPMRQDIIVVLVGFVVFLLFRYFHGWLFGANIVALA